MALKEKKIRVNLKEKSYDIFIKQGIISSCGKYIKSLKIGKKILIVTQDGIPKQFISTVEKSLKIEGYKTFTVVLPSGEHHKNLNSLLKIINFAIKNKFERKDTFLALGGGVTSDMTGFAASIYYRGVNFIGIPTTLLSMVDASIGGKTSVNIPEGKNLLGTFYQPKCILIDPNCLKTLPKRELLVGMGEVVKYALLDKTANCSFSKQGFSSSSFFNFLKLNKKTILSLNSEAIFKIISYSAYVKAQVVSKDEKESNLRAILNLGHTFAHGIEQAYNYKTYTHGEAVSIGICLAFKLAYKNKMISKTNYESTINLISDLGLPIKVKDLTKLKKILESMTLDKKVENGKLRFILPYSTTGKVKVVNDITLNDVKDLF